MIDPTTLSVGIRRATCAHARGCGTGPRRGCRTESRGPTQIGNLVPNDRVWHNGHTRRQLSVTVDDTGRVPWTSVLGQSRIVSPYDYRLEDPLPPPEDKELA